MIDLDEGYEEARMIVPGITFESYLTYERLAESVVKQLQSLSPEELEEFLSRNK